MIAQADELIQASRRRLELWGLTPEQIDAIPSTGPPAAQITISSMEIVADSTIGAGDFAATTGRATWVSGTRDSGAPTVRRRFLMVWRRDGDGRWRIARELLNEDR